MERVRIYREPLAFLAGAPSTPAVDGRQVAIESGERVYVASGSTVYVCTPEYPPDGECTFETAKEGNAPLPNRLRATRHAELAGPSHAAPIATLLCAPPTPEHSLPARLASVDAAGLACVSLLGAGGRTYALRPATAAERGWAGAAFNPRKPDEALVARFFAKGATVFDGERPARELHAAQHPTGVAYVDENLAAMTELNQLSVWDLRERRPCVERLSPSLDTQLCVAASSTGIVACAGADRNVHVYDARKWTPVAHWPNALKYEVTWLAFSRRRPNTCFVGARDNEFACGTILPQGKAAKPPQEEGGKRYSFRADGRWIGLALHEESDVVAGLTDCGSLYLVQHS